jgi:hypothetical protein
MGCRQLRSSRSGNTDHSRKFCAEKVTIEKRHTCTHWHLIRNQLGPSNVKEGVIGKESPGEPSHEDKYSPRKKETEVLL